MTQHTPGPHYRQALDFLLAHREDSATARAGFVWPRPERFNWALDHFDVLAREHGDRTALWLVEEDGHETRLGYGELSRRSNQTANFLRRLGVKRGDRILLMLPNHVALWETMLAAMKLGAVVIPATLLLSGEELLDRLDRGQVRHIVAMASDAQKFAGLAPQATRIAVGGAEGWIDYAASHDAPSAFTPDDHTGADDPLLLYFTSGTTAKPKLVLHTHVSYPIGHLSTIYWIGLQPGDIHYNISSPGWAKHAWSCFFAPLSVGATVFSYNAARFNAAATLKAISRCGVTTLCAPPTVWRMLVQEDLSAHPVALRELVGAGEPLNPEIIEQIRAAWGLTIRDGFGQTETTAQIGNPPGQPLKAGSMGRPLPGYDIALLDTDGQPADEGEIAVRMEPRTPSVMQGYLDDPAKTAQVMRDGWYRTGDVASRDAEGYLTYVGRSDDVFKSSDYRISPFELESVLIEHEAVAEAAIVPSPDPVRLSVPKAFIVLRRGYEPSPALAADIFAYTRIQLGAFKRIRRLEFKELPKTISGKIRRVELRREELAARANGERSPGEYLDQDFT